MQEILNLFINTSLSFRIAILDSRSLSLLYQVSCATIVLIQDSVDNNENLEPTLDAGHKLVCRPNVQNDHEVLISGHPHPVTNNSMTKY